MAEQPPKPVDDSSEYAGRIAAQVKRKLRARRNSTPGIWFGIGMMGVIGWSVAIPTVLGAALGIWLDQHYPSPRSWTLALLVAGLVLGCVLAWHWVDREDRAMLAEQSDDDD